MVVLAGANSSEYRALRRVLGISRPRKKPSKFKNRITYVDGRRFHSKREADHFVELKLRQDAGEIKALECQPRFPCHVNGIKIGTYVSDFRYFDNRAKEWRVVDVKGCKTSAYIWKKKHVEAEYGITITEVV